MFTKQVSRPVDTVDPPSWPPRPAGRANSKKDLVTGPIRGFCALPGGVDPKDSLEVAAAQDQHPVQAFGPDRADPPLREGVRLRGPDRRLDDPHPFGPEDLVERTGVLGIPVADEEPDALKPLPHRQVASLLSDPRRVGVRSDAEDVHSTGPDPIAKSTY